jgi:hypothetical protein
MKLGRLSSGWGISGGAAILLLGFTFLRWYGISVETNLLVYLSLFDDGGNAWQTLDVLPIFLVLASTVTVGATLLRLSRLTWESPVPPGGVVCVLGGVAGLLILIRIVFPPGLVDNLEGLESEGFTLDVTLHVGIYLALAAACGIAYGGYRAMREEGMSFTDLRARRRGQGHAQ